MSEERIAQFRERAQAGVGLPDIEALERRGATLRRRRVAGTAVAAVAAAGVIGFWLLQLPGGDQTDSSPVVDRTAEEAPVEAVALVDGVDVEPGVPVYDEFPLSTGGSVRIDLMTPAEGWFAHLGDPERGLNIGPDRAWTGLLWHEATGIYEERCDDRRGPGAESVPITDSLQPLVERPWVTVVEEPRADRIGGRAAQHARLLVQGCQGDYSTPIAAGIDDGSLPPATDFDVWLVPLPEAETAIVVLDPTGDGSGAVRRQWDEVVESLEITVEPPS